ncbi:DUF3710 domain-containing protein [Actinomyces sp. 186855]|uniref:DUF3710 domain-containing protein n=1 Tax=Actinomyces sp. 186855 TaxID=2761164 RepID=UPI002016AB32|nr:DUF3710 domain-containing protein [Actinomyces sp. 186855]MCL3791105.1 DUF3710 domain-containing protein [Actinomyces sp. 186855]
MGLFSRRRDDVRTADSHEEDTAAEADEAAGTDEQPQSATGPWDVADAPDAPRIDLGSLRVPAVDGMQMRLDPPREVLPLHVPGAAPAPAAHDLPGLDPIEPGPTIAEVR